MKHEITDGCDRLGRVSVSMGLGRKPVPQSNWGLLFTAPINVSPSATAIKFGQTRGLSGSNIFKSGAENGCGTEDNHLLTAYCPKISTTRGASVGTKGRKIKRFVLITSHISEDPIEQNKKGPGGVPSP